MDDLDRIAGHLAYIAVRSREKRAEGPGPAPWYQPLSNAWDQVSGGASDLWDRTTGGISNALKDQLGEQMARQVATHAGRGLIGAGIGAGLGGVSEMFRKKRNRRPLSGMLHGGLLGGLLGGAVSVGASGLGDGDGDSDGDGDGGNPPGGRVTVVDPDTPIVGPLADLTINPVADSLSNPGRLFDMSRPEQQAASVIPLVETGVSLGRTAADARNAVANISHLLNTNSTPHSTLGPAVWRELQAARRAGAAEFSRAVQSLSPEVRRAASNAGLATRSWQWLSGRPFSSYLQQPGAYQSPWLRPSWRTLPIRAVRSVGGRLGTTMLPMIIADQLSRARPLRSPLQVLQQMHSQLGQQENR